LGDAPKSQLGQPVGDDDGTEAVELEHRGGVILDDDCRAGQRGQFGARVPQRAVDWARAATSFAVIS